MKLEIGKNVRGKTYNLIIKGNKRIIIEPHEILKSIMIGYSNGIYYWDLVWMFQKYVLFGWLSMKVQEFLRKRKIYWHDPIMGQCTRYMECCAHRVPEDMKGLFNAITYASAEEIPVIYYTKEER